MSLEIYGLLKKYGLFEIYNLDRADFYQRFRPFSFSVENRMSNRILNMLIQPVSSLS